MGYPGASCGSWRALRSLFTALTGSEARGLSILRFLDGLLTSCVCVADALPLVCCGRLAMEDPRLEALRPGCETCSELLELWLPVFVLAEAPVIVGFSCKGSDHIELLGSPLTDRTTSLLMEPGSAGSVMSSLLAAALG